MASKPALIINTVLEGSWTLATRTPTLVTEFVGALENRSEARRLSSELR